MFSAAIKKIYIEHIPPENKDRSSYTSETNNKINQTAIGRGESSWKDEP
jgi:hypothetical protein